MLGDLAAGVAHTLTAGRKSMRLKATEAGTIFAREVKLVSGDTIRVNR